MGVPDVSNLAVPDAIVALRSFGRRFRATVLPLTDDPSLEELAERVGPDSVSALDIVVAVTNTWVLLGQALRQVLVDDDPVVPPGVTDRHARVWDPLPRAEVDHELVRLDGEADVLADAADAVSSRDWHRTARVAGGSTIEAIDLIREAVRVGGQGLADAEAAIRAARA